MIEEYQVNDKEPRNRWVRHDEIDRPKSGQTKMMSLKELYRVYTTIAAKPGEPVPLAAFKLSAEDTEKLFSGYDEDYHISRFLHFSDDGGQRYTIDGEPATHVAIDPEISSIL